MKKKTGGSTRFEIRPSKFNKVYDRILKTDKDRELFFTELLNPGTPNQELKKAEEYTQYI